MFSINSSHPSKPKRFVGLSPKQLMDAANREAIYVVFRPSKVAGRQVGSAGATRAAVRATPRSTDVSREAVRAELQTRELFQFPGRLLNQSSPEGDVARGKRPRHEQLRNIDVPLRQPLATWDPEDFQSDFDLVCDNAIDMSGFECAQFRRFPMGDPT